MNHSKIIVLNSNSAQQFDLNEQNEEIQQFIGLLKKDFQNPNHVHHQTRKCLAPTSKTQNQIHEQNNKDGKRMKLIDYINIKNTYNKNIRFKKEKSRLADNQLPKSRINQENQKAFKVIVEEMVAELKSLSLKASEISQLVQHKIVYSQNAEELLKICNARNIIKQNIFGSLAQFEKTLGIDSEKSSAKSKIKTQQNKPQLMQKKMKQFLQIGK